MQHLAASSSATLYQVSREESNLSRLGNFKVYAPNRVSALGRHGNQHCRWQVAVVPHLAVYVPVTKSLIIGIRIHLEAGSA